MIGGIFGILPILGFWMFPLGLAFIALDIPWTKGRIFEWMTRLEKDLKAGPEKNRISYHLANNHPPDSGEYVLP